MKNILFLFLLIPAVTFGQTPSTKQDHNTKLTTAITVPTAKLKQYVGVYELKPGFQVTISVEGNKLFALAPGDQEKTEFVPESDTKFYMPGAGAKLEFIEENGQQYILVNMGGGLKLKKIS